MIKKGCKKRYFVALDEANHYTSRELRDPEIVAAVFSSNPRDADIISQRRRRKLNHRDLALFFLQGGRYWQIVAIPRSELEKKDEKSSRNPLIFSLPHIFRPFVREFGHPITAYLQFDGGMLERDIPGLEEGIKELNSVKVIGYRQFPKNGPSEGCYDYSLLLNIADEVARHAYENIFKGMSINSIQRIGGAHLI